MSVATQAAQTSPLAAVFERYHVGWETRNPDMIASFHSEDTLFWLHDGSDPVKGRDALRRHCAELFSAPLRRADGENETCYLRRSAAGMSSSSCNSWASARSNRSGGSSDTAASSGYEQAVPSTNRTDTSARLSSSKRSR